MATAEGSTQGGHRRGNRGQVVTDVLVVLWVILWLGVGIRVGQEVDDLKELSTTVSKSGAAVSEAGRAVDRLSATPLVGEEIGPLADRVVAAGESARASGRTSRDAIEELSVLLAFAIGAIPSAFLLLYYLPLRLTGANERSRARE